MIIIVLAAFCTQVIQSYGFGVRERYAMCCAHVSDDDDDLTKNTARAPRVTETVLSGVCVCVSGWCMLMPVVE